MRDNLRAAKYRPTANGRRRRRRRHSIITFQKHINPAPQPASMAKGRIHAMPFRRSNLAGGKIYWPPPPANVSTRARLNKIIFFHRNQSRSQLPIYVCASFCDDPERQAYDSLNIVPAGQPAGTDRLRVDARSAIWPPNPQFRARRRATFMQICLFHADRPTDRPTSCSWLVAANSRVSCRCWINSRPALLVVSWSPQLN